MKLTLSQAKKTKAQEIQAIREQLEKKEHDQENLAIRANARVEQLEKNLREAQERFIQVRDFTTESLTLRDLHVF